MKLDLKNLAVEYTVRLSPDERAQIGWDTRTHEASIEDVRIVLGKKLLKIILMYFHAVQPEDMERALERVTLVRPVLLWDVGPWKVRMIEVCYRLAPRYKGYWRHVFRFTPDEKGGLNGRVVSFSRRYCRAGK